MVFVFPLRDMNKPSRRPYVNYVLILTNIFVFFFFFLQSQEAMYNAFYFFGSIPSDILQGRKVWTLLTSMFLHSDIIHLLGNMVFLWIFGDNIEEAFGHGKYLLFYLVGGVFSSFTHIASTLVSSFLAFSPLVTPDLYIPTLGASGAISSVLGAYLLLYPQSRIKSLVIIFFIIKFSSIPAYYYLGFWFLYQLLMGLGILFGLSSSVAFWAHIGGYIFGIIIVKTLGMKRRSEIMRSRAPYRFDRPIRPITGPLTITPFVDTIIEGDKIRVFVNLPGLDQQHINIGISDWEFIISAEYRDVKFYRKVPLSVRVLPQAYDIIYRNGVLSFTLRIAQ